MVMVLAKGNKIGVLQGGSQFWNQINWSCIAPEERPNTDLNRKQGLYSCVEHPISLPGGWEHIFMELVYF